MSLRLLAEGVPDPSAAEFAIARAAVEARKEFAIEVLYGDHEGGQRVVTRFAMFPRGEDGWLVRTSTATTRASPSAGGAGCARS